MGISYKRRTCETKSLVIYLAIPSSCLIRKQAQRQSSINEAERKVESQQSLPSQLKTLEGDIEEKRKRLTKIKTDMGTANHDAKLAEKTEQAKSLEAQRDALNRELRTLSIQADSRAKLDLKRAEVKSKNGEIQSTLVA
jgi:DNA repair protein RAD50